MKVQVLLMLAQTVSAFTNVHHISKSPFRSDRVTSTVSVQMSTVIETEEDQLTPQGLLKRDRYIATNRFAVRSNKGPKFEARWANRKSRLASLPGFKYFHLMRRVKLNEDGTTVYDEGDASDGSNMGNYVSFTIWEKKSDFSAWRKGDAFKEAHGGTSISAFMSTMISSALILKGPPRPAFYDGILHQSLPPTNVPETVDGWRKVEADGKVTLATECFVACNQFFVPKENAAAFEERWASRESKLQDCEGFVSFTMCRRDASSKGHGVTPMEPSEPTYVSTTVWKDRASFEKWRKGNAFKQAHGQGQNTPNFSENAKAAPPQWSKPPEPVFYEGTLVISKPEGA